MSPGTSLHVTMDIPVTSMGCDIDAHTPGMFLEAHFHFLPKFRPDIGKMSPASTVDSLGDYWPVHLTYFLPLSRQVQYRKSHTIQGVQCGTLGPRPG